jgi:hypothetical protein
MKFLITAILLLAASINFNIFSQVNCVNKHETYRRLDDNSSEKTNLLNQGFNNSQLIPEGGTITPFYTIGPEISTQLSGYYDYQTNGECKHYINRYNSSNLHAIFMTALDSFNVSGTRRTVYAFSSDEGEHWTYMTQVPVAVRSGFCALTALNDGSAVITNHYQPTSELRAFLHYDIAPGAATFVSVTAPYGLVWPGCAKLSNGNILVVGETYRGATATDTGSISIYNYTTHTFGPLINFIIPGVLQLNMRWTYAAGPNGKALYVMCPISDVAGNFSKNRLFYSTSSDFGSTWTQPAVLYNPQIINGDTVVPFFGLDAVYDPAGNFYVAFNSTSPSGLFASSKLWVIKNTGTPNLVAQHSGVNGIPEAANTPIHADAGICTIDHPTLGVSDSGTCVYVAYSVQFQNDTLGGFNKCHIYISRALISNMTFGTPLKVTNSGPGSYDERYPSINQVIPNLGSPNFSTVFLVYQKDPQPGSSAFNDGARQSRATLMFRKIFDYGCYTTGIQNIGNEIPGSYNLHQNYPNPFNPDTKIRFELPERSDVSLNIYDVTGKLVTALIYIENLEPGMKEISFNASSLASGVYFYTIEARSGNSLKFIETKRMVLLK